MKKFISLLLVFIVIFSFASCKGNKNLDPKLIGVWSVESSQINSVDKSKSMMFELMSNMYFFEGANVEFRNDGKTSINGMIGSYKVPRANVIETKNAQGEVSECTYTISGNTLVMNFYSNEYIVTLVKGAKTKSSTTPQPAPEVQVPPVHSETMIPNTSIPSTITPGDFIKPDVEAIKDMQQEVLEKMQKDVEQSGSAN